MVIIKVTMIIIKVTMIIMTVIKMMVITKTKGRLVFCALWLFP